MAAEPDVVFDHDGAGDVLLLPDRHVGIGEPVVGGAQHAIRPDANAVADFDPATLTRVNHHTQVDAHVIANRDAGRLEDLGAGHGREVAADAGEMVAVEPVAEPAEHADVREERHRLLKQVEQFDAKGRSGHVGITARRLARATAHGRRRRSLWPALE
jgi:hypothetical protein